LTLRSALYKIVILEVAGGLGPLLKSVEKGAAVETAISICRLCTSSCPIEVTIDQGRAVKVVGDRRSDMYDGYSCAKGRALPELHNRPDRLLHSQKRQPDGSYVAIAADDAIAEIAERTRAILDEHGPRAIASFTGTRIIEHGAFYALGLGFMGALGSPMQFSPLTLDQPGDLVAHAFHGTWMGGEVRLEECEAWLLVGTNPIVSHQYWANNPVGRITSAVRHGTRLVVVDPRVTETARHAHVHLQPRPGEDNTILAGLLALLFEWGALDADFVDLNVTGLERLKAAVAPYTPEYVCRRADLPGDKFEAAARLLAEAKTGGVYCGTGTSMSNMGGNLAFYLGLALMSVRGWWAREGDPFLRPHALLPEISPKAQPRNPFPAANFGEKMRVRGLQGGVCGVPAGAMFEEILKPGTGQIKALFNLGGNPLMAVPDTSLAYRALSNLDLYVTTDVSMSNNARMAHYVIAVKMGLETSTTSYISEALGYMHRGMGLEDPFAQYAPAVISAPPDSDLIEDWQLYYRLARALGLDLFVVNACGLEGAFDVPPIVHPLNMENEPTTEDILEIMCSDGRIPFSHLKGDAHGHIFDELRMTVGKRDPACDQHLEVGAPEMMTELADQYRRYDSVDLADRERDYPFLLIGRRDKGFVNGTGQDIDKLIQHRSFNPAYVNPADMAVLDVVDGQLVEIRSANGHVQGVVAGDPSLRRGVISMTHAFGQNPADLQDPVRFGVNTNQLLSINAEYDPITGMPRMGAVPVRITKLDRLAGDHVPA
jgi:anaerobic selenocysteine-containing dehydrogenase